MVSFSGWTPFEDDKWWSSKDYKFKQSRLVEKDNSDFHYNLQDWLHFSGLASFEDDKWQKWGHLIFKRIINLSNHILLKKIICLGF